MYAMSVFFFYQKIHYLQFYTQWMLLFNVNIDQQKSAIDPR